MKSALSRLLRSPTALILTVLIIAVAGIGVWYVAGSEPSKADQQAPTTSSSQSKTTEPLAATKPAEPSDIKERAQYMYDYYWSPGDFRIEDLETKGYLT